MALTCRLVLALRLVAILVLISTPATGAQSSRAVVTRAFTHATVIDVRDGRRLLNQTVVIVGNRIQRVAATDSVTVPAGASVVEARGRFIIPGLWDMHVHPKRYVDIAYPLFIATGVTGVRDAGSDVPLATFNQLKREIASGARVGPRLLVSGPSVNEDFKHRYDRVTADTGQASHFIYVPAALARYVVDSLKAAGADFIKTYSMSGDMYRAIASEARRVGLRLGGHVDALDSREAADSGVVFVDHETSFSPNVCGEVSGGSFDEARLDPSRCAAGAQYLRRKNAWVTLMGTLIFRPDAVERARRYLPASFPWNIGESRAPDGSERSSTAMGMAGSAAGPASTADWATLVSSDDANYGPTRPTLRSIAALHTAHVPIVVGTDMAIEGQSILALVTPGFSVHNTLECFVLAGMTPLEALQTATLNPALALRATDSLGTVEAGKVADLVLLDADPLIDIWNTTKISAVVADGRYYDRAALDGLLLDAQRTAARR